jgi:hypothetical protein
MLLWLTNLDNPSMIYRNDDTRKTRHICIWLVLMNIWQAAILQRINDNLTSLSPHLFLPYFQVQ